MGKRGKGLTFEEKQFIFDNTERMSDSEIARELGRAPRTVTKYRQEKLKIKDKVHPSLDPIQMDPDTKEKFFRVNLENTYLWNEVKNQFSKDELDFYMQEWAQLCIQFKDVLATEKRQIHDLIVTEILDHRMLKKIRFLEQEFENLVISIKAYGDKYDLDDNEQAAEVDAAFRDILSVISAQQIRVTKDHDTLIEQKNKILQHLNARRKDRVTETIEAKNNIIGLIEAMNNEEVRNAQSRCAEAYKRALKKEENKWLNEDVIFPDGKKDRVLKKVVKNEDS